MKRTLIQQYVTGIVKGLMQQATSIREMKHRPTKGVFRELFVTNVLARYLVDQFGVGSGIIINQRGVPSDQTDIVVYDNRVLLPFIREERLGVFPIESVVATIEVKSNASQAEIVKADKAAERLHEIGGASGSWYHDKLLPEPPNCSFFGFFGNGPKALRDEKNGRKWLEANIKHLKSICVMQKFTWVKLREEGWMFHRKDSFAEETKTYFGVLLDNIRTLGEYNYRLLLGELGAQDYDSWLLQHRDWISIYTRDNEGGKRVFDTLDRIRSEETSGQ